MVVVAINQRCVSGTVNIAMSVEYPTGLNSYSIQPDTFTVSGRRVLNCYVNSWPDLEEKWKTTVGRYIIIELEPMTLTDGDLPDCIVTQRREIRRASGSIIPAWEEGIKPRCAQQSVGEGGLECMFQLVPGGPGLHFSLTLPYRYTPAKRYAMHLIFCRDGRCKRGEAFSLMLYNPELEGWGSLPDQAALFLAARSVFHSVLRQYSISAEEIYLSGLSPDRAFHVLKAPHRLRPMEEEGTQG